MSNRHQAAPLPPVITTSSNDVTANSGFAQTIGLMQSSDPPPASRFMSNASNVSEPRKFSKHNANSPSKSSHQMYQHYNSVGDGHGFNSGSPERKSGYIATGPYVRNIEIPHMDVRPTIAQGKHKFYTFHTNFILLTHNKLE